MGGNMDDSRIAALFEKTRTICIGRFLIDVPADAEIVYGPAEVLYPVKVFRDKAHDMDSLIAERLVEIEKDKPRAYGMLRNKDSMLGHVISGILPDQKMVFGMSPGSFAFYNIESYVKSKSDVIMQDAEAISAEHSAKIIQELNALAPLLRSRGDSQIPTESGVCIQDGFIKDSGKTLYEMVSLGVRLASLPDVHLSLSLTNKDILVSSDALEPRVKQAEQIARSQGHGAWYERIKNLRRGRREIGRWAGYEVLARKPAQGAARESHEFAFLSQGEPNNPYVPVLDIELHSGILGNQTGGVKPSVTDEEAVAIWDRLTSSIRVRPYQ
jgi:hypothetical protein